MSDAAVEALVAALQDALAVEHAALWCYALSVAFLPDDQAATAREDADAHTRLRVGLQDILTQLGRRPVSALPAYRVPAPVDDAASAANLLVVAETDALAVWRSVLERTADLQVRAFGLEALTAGTLRCSTWRTITGQQPAIPPFPGRP